FSSRRRHTRSTRDWSSDVCSSDLPTRRLGEPRDTARVHHDGSWLRAPVWQRAALPARFSAPGPGIVAEEGATLWIAPGWTARLHGTGTLVLVRARPARGPR